MKKFMNNAGFTLVELIVVIAILGILAAVAVPAYSGYIEKANATADTQVVAAVKTAADAALVKVGPIDGLVVTDAADADVVVATIGTGANAKSYVLKGTATGVTDTADATIKADFATYFGGNDIAFKAKMNGSNVTKATWANTGWTFSVN